MKYRKKPVVIEAIRFRATDDGYKEACDFVGKTLPYNDEEGQIRINTLEGDMIANDGDYVIKGVKGEFYPCKADIFELSYERA